MLRSLFFVAVAAMLAVATNTPGCTTDSSGNTICAAELCIDLSCFGRNVDVQIRAGVFSINYENIGAQNHTLKNPACTDTSRCCLLYTVPFVGRTVPTVQISEGSNAVYITNISEVNVSPPTGLSQVMTNYIAYLTIHLENYDPSNALNQMPGFTGNSWSVKLRNNGFVFREYIEQSNTTVCSYTNPMPLSALGPNPTTSAYRVCVLPVANITVRVSERLPTSCPSLETIFVDCHSDTSVNRRTDPNCSPSSGYACDSGLCVDALQVPAHCKRDFESLTPGSELYPKYGLGYSGDTAPFALNITWKKSSGDIAAFQYRTTPSAPWNVSYNWVVLATNNYHANVMYPAGASVVEMTRVTSCYDSITGTCELQPLASWLQLEIGDNAAHVQVTQGSYLTINETNVSAPNAFFCILNVVACPSVTYESASAPGSGIVVTPDNWTGSKCVNCNVPSMYCYSGPYYQTVTPNWGCWASDALPESAFPSNGIFVDITFNGTQQFLVGSSFLPLSADSPLLSFQIPRAQGAHITVSEGNCENKKKRNTGALRSEAIPTELEFCEYYSVAILPGPAEASASTVDLGRILVAFELFYLPADNGVTILFNEPVDALTYRITPDVGGEPGCFCVLPVVLKAKIFEQAACWQSGAISCIEDAVPGMGADCSICDFVNILRFDLRGLPRKTSAELFAGPTEASKVTLFQENWSGSTSGWTPSPKINAQGTPTSPTGPNTPPAMRFPNGELTGNTASVFKPPSSNTLTTTFVVQPNVDRIDLSFYAWPLGYTVVNPPAPTPSVGGSVEVRGSITGTILQATNIQTNNNVWTLNSRAALFVTAGETVTLIFKANGTNPNATPVVDNILVEGYQLDLRSVRTFAWVGDYYNNVTVLRNGAAVCDQRYCLNVNDEGAQLQLCTSCNSCSDCEVGPYTRVLTLNLAAEPCYDKDEPDQVLPQCAGYVPRSPVNKRSTSVQVSGAKSRYFDPEDNSVGYVYYDNCGYSIEQQLKVQLYVKGSTTPFRTIARQGGLNGCSGIRDPYCEANPEYDPFGKKRKRDLEGPPPQWFMMQDPLDAPTTCWNGNGWYTVLRGEVDVTISEQDTDKVTRSVDCREAAPHSGSCSVCSGIVSNLVVDTECEGFGPHPTSGDSTQQWAATRQIGTNIVLRDASGRQVRGPRGKVYYNNCSASKWEFIGPTCRDCGYRQNCFAVLNNRKTVTVQQTPIGRPTVIYPDLRTFPQVNVSVDCTSGNCSTIMGQIFSYLQIESLRGAPSALTPLLPFALINFGNIAQNTIMAIEEDLLWTQPGQINRICVIADLRNQYSVFWGSYASNGANNAYANCSSTTNAIDNCRNPLTAPGGKPEVVVIPKAARVDASSEESKAAQKVVEEVSQLLKAAKH